MLLSYDELISDIVDKHVLTDTYGHIINLDQVNGASIDITLGNEIMVERYSMPDHPLKMEIDLKEKERINMRKFTIPESGYQILPNEFILASSNEIFNLPADIAAEYVLKSSMARCGLEHLTAGFADPHWHNSHLTLEFKNLSQFHTLLIKPNMKIGQVKFYRVKPVDECNGYGVRGQYNNSIGVTESGGIR